VFPLPGKDGREPTLAQDDASSWLLLARDDESNGRKRWRELLPGGTIPFRTPEVFP